MGCGVPPTATLFLGTIDGKADLTLMQLDFTLPAATPEGPGSLSLAASANTSLKLDVVPSSPGLISAKIEGLDEALVVNPAPAIATVISIDRDVSLVIVLKNHAPTPLTVSISLSAEDPPPAVQESGPPTLEDVVVDNNTYCSYSDRPPYVRDVAWHNPKIQEAMKRLGPGWRSTFSYGEWKVAYGLENESPLPETKRLELILRTAESLGVGEQGGTVTFESLAGITNGSLRDKHDSVAELGQLNGGCIAGTQTCNEGLSCDYGVCIQAVTADELVAEFTDDDGLNQAVLNWNRSYRNARVRNFIRVLCGEFRDYPALLEAKLDTIIERQIYAGGEELESVDLEKDLFSQLTYPAYQRLLSVMGGLYAQRKAQRTSSSDGYNYGYGATGFGSRRVGNSVAPWTHCEMKFIFSRFLVASAPASLPADYEAQYGAFQLSNCTDDDLQLMYNFRGHKNFKPLWLESNAFIWNSRRARGVAISRKTHDYYQRPFAERFHRSRQAWASYLFYPEADHAALRQASTGGGGPILYITDQDTNGDNVADYRLFAQAGCGDQGVGTTNPTNNCNMVAWETAAATPNSVAHAANWQPEYFGSPDMGFLQTFTTFEERMARFNQALDRHTNWGPTSYYMIDASKVGAAPQSIRYLGAYSPIVACSYDISASDGFARSNYSTTHPFEKSMVKWMFVMRFRAENYYDEKDLRESRPMNFAKHYFNETSLSNDYYVERALDHFGYIPPGEAHANIYFPYGQRQIAPTYEAIPAPGE